MTLHLGVRNKQFASLLSARKCNNLTDPLLRTISMFCYVVNCQQNDDQTNDYSPNVIFQWDIQISTILWGIYTHGRPHNSKYCMKYDINDCWPSAILAPLILNKPQHNWVCYHLVFRCCNGSFQRCSRWFSFDI